MATIAVPVTNTKPDGYQMANGRRAVTEAAFLLPKQTLGAGITVGPVHEIGARSTARLKCVVTAKAGTAPTLDVTLQGSYDGVTNWQTLGTFAQKTDAGAPPNDGLVMSAVASAGTTPPVVTLTGALTGAIDLRVECTSIAGGATLGLWTGRYSTDGGVTFVAFTSAATVPVIDLNGTDTGIVLNIAAGNAAVDNVWTASTAGFERKRFNALPRFVRAVAKIGGSATPTMEAEVSGEFV